jgi:hypothetical protein
LLFKKIVFHFLTKVDGHVSRVNRDKCPENRWIIYLYLLRTIPCFFIRRTEEIAGSNTARSTVLPPDGVFVLFLSIYGDIDL